MPRFPFINPLMRCQQIFGFDEGVRSLRHKMFYVNLVKGRFCVNFYHLVLIVLFLGLVNIFDIRLLHLKKLIQKL